MDHVELERLVHGGQKLDALCPLDESVFWTAHNARTCRQGSSSSSNSESVSAQIISESPSTLLDYLQIKLHDYQDRYRTKRVTARYSVAAAAAAGAQVVKGSDGLDAATSDDDDDGDALTLQVHTYAEHLDAANCHAGSWSAAWHIQVVSEQEAHLSGCMAFHGHASECGSNVQTRATRTFARVTIGAQEEVVNSLVAQFEQSTLSYDEQLATKIVDQIARYETEWHEALNEMYNSNVEEALRKLRRILPITKTRFKWDSAAQKNVRLLNARNTK
jgi:F-actin capping protein alpha subunit